MHVGMSVFFQNINGRPDWEIYRENMAFADLADPFGFDSIWGAEHHFSDYTMCPNVTQFLTYMAARSPRLLLGSMVTVLPWHEPVRVAEETAVLDTLSDGRVLLGLGRGVGRVEFDNLRLPMGESRQRFAEYAEAIIGALETGTIQHQGEFYRQPPAPIRPKPRHSFRGRIYAAAVSPESSKLMARLGVGLLVIPQKPWDTTLRELKVYRETYLAINGVEAPPPLLVSWVACHEDAAAAEAMKEKYIRSYCKSAMDHYDFASPELASIPGYEYYGRMSQRIREQGEDIFIDFLTEMNVWGTPQQCFDRIMSYQKMLNANGFVGVFNYGGMPIEEATKSARLFAREVLPRLKEVAVPGRVGALRLAA
jgi:alkanesulfonate monooxygenase SsuD/methylene tetrahydromethanopterin reductase-like flavin-dependent oxidoreductase (luciferase family)